MNATTNTQARIVAQCQKIAELLIQKNNSYGDSALHPIGVFGRGRATDLLRVRIDDKLSRIRNAPDAFGEDAIADLTGYLILLALAVEDERTPRAAAGAAAATEPRPATEPAASRTVPEIDWGPMGFGNNP